MEKAVAVIDLKSFYASVECVARHLDPFSTPLAVVDPNRGNNTVVMSASPCLKEKYGASNVCRKKDLPHVPDLIMAVPRMELYLRTSAKVMSIFLDYVAEEDLHIYSVDEAFLHLTPYKKLYGDDPRKIVSKIQKRIKKELGLTATAGIGPNPFMAKVALDCEGKKRPPYIAIWTEEDVQKKLWKIQPIEKIWGINVGIKSHLSRIGIKSIKDLATSDVNLLKKEFGIMGEQLHDLANGIDGSIISEGYAPESPSLSYGQTLYRPYSKEEGYLILREIVDALGIRLRKAGLETGSASLYVGCKNGKGAAIERSFPYRTIDEDHIYISLQNLYKNYDFKDIVAISVSLGRLRPIGDYSALGFDDDPKQEAKKEALAYTMDEIRYEFGPDAVLRATSLLPYSMVKERHRQIGGHRR